MRRLALVLGLLLPSAVSAADETAFFESKVRPILIERCHACHSQAKGKRKGGLALDSAAAFRAGGESGPVVVMGNLGQSLLIRAVRYDHETLHMPPSGRLPASEVALLEEWVRRGAVFPGPTSATPARASVDPRAGRSFWSFRSLQKTRPPTTQDTVWARDSLDVYLLAALEQKGLKPTPETNRRTLIRRVTLDLVGLPPTPEEVAAFVNDPDPNAYERLVDRLLASPRHGERWARFWLDLVRYADVTEPWADVKAPGAVYRDWVVQALNADMSYAEFVRRQLAADLIPGLPPTERAALGFLGLAPTYWKELKLDKDVIRTVVAEEWEERVASVTGTFLGLTAACARCHDHKFDPITMQDYYALAGVFASTRQADYPMCPDQAVPGVKKALERIHDLKAEIEKLVAKKDTEGVAKREAEIARLKRETPYFEAPLAPAAEEASLVVLADGPHRTKLEYRPGVSQDVAVQIRGNPASSGPVVARRFLAVLSPDSPRLFQRGSGRLDLADALVEEAAPLVARVMVNRMWRHHFGEGLVRTPSDFGAQGERPTHPELLDQLAHDLITSGWSLKSLHRRIVLSSAYRQGSHCSPEMQNVDPENRLVGRMTRRRLEVEAWRDAMLAVTGELDGRLGGPALDLEAPDQVRRTLYGKITRRELSDLLRLHDVPDASWHSPGRIPTTTPLQGLFVLNSPFFQARAKALARRLLKEAQEDQGRLVRAFDLLYARSISPDETAASLEFLRTSGGGEAAWAAYSQVLLARNEFLFLD